MPILAQLLEAQTDFDAIAFEVERAEIFEQTEAVSNPELFYEVQEVEECFGTIYQITHMTRILGAYYRIGNKWLAEAFYSNYRVLPLKDKSEKQCRSKDSAYRFIVNCYQG